MKTKVGLLALLLIISAAFSNCKKEDQITPLNTIINTVVIPGEWKITEFNELSTDKTNKYKTYSFKFNTNGTIVANTIGSSANGAWSTIHEKDHLKMIIYFATSPLDDLSDDWQIMNRTDSVIELQHHPAANDGVNYLTFHRQ